MCPSALPSIRSRCSLMTAMIGTDWVFMSATLPPGVEIHMISPVRLSKATYRCRGGPAYSPHMPPMTDRMTRSSSSTGFDVRPPYPEARPISSARRQLQTMPPSRSKALRWPSMLSAYK